MNTKDLLPILHDYKQRNCTHGERMEDQNLKQITAKIKSISKQRKRWALKLAHWPNPPQDDGNDDELTICQDTRWHSVNPIGINTQKYFKSKIRAKRKYN